MRNTLNITSLCLSIAVMAGAASAQQADNEPAVDAADGVVVRELGELFGASVLPPVAPREVGSVTTRTITLDSRMLRRVNIGDRLSITPEPGLTERWLVADVDRRANGVVVIRMSQPMNPTAVATFVMVEDATAMTMQIASQKRLYRLQFAGNDNYHVWIMSQGALPREGDAGHADHLPPDFAPTPDDDDYLPPEGFGERNPGGCNNANPVFDVWLMYTVTARNGLGGTTAARAECALAVEHANTAYINSNLPTRMRLIAATETTYDEAVDQDTDLDRLTGTADGFIDGIHATRDTYNADLVHMVTDNGSGLGWCGGVEPSLGECFSVSRWTRVAASFTLAHEIGHNIGCGHDHANAGSCSSTTYAYGHRFTGDDSNGYCTVLAYPDGIYERVLHFSDPDIDFMGAPTGVASGPSAADNARVIASTDNIVEDLQLTRYDIYVDFAYVGGEIGTASNPYNTFVEGVTFIDVPNTGAGEVPSLYLDAGQQNYTGTVSKAMTIRPCGGAVTIGTP